VSLREKNLHLAADLVQRQNAAHEFLVVPAKTAVEAIVRADVGNIERSEENYAPAVDRLFYVKSRFVDTGNYLFVLRLQQYRQFFQVQALAISSLRHNLQRSPSVCRTSRLQ